MYWFLFSLVERLERAPVLPLRERPIDSTTWTFFVGPSRPAKKPLRRTTEARALSATARWFALPAR
jgi:hypothetical protein